MVKLAAVTSLAISVQEVRALESGKKWKSAIAQEFCVAKSTALLLSRTNK